jgi:hypothetical protein
MHALPFRLNVRREEARYARSCIVVARHFHVNTVRLLSKRPSSGSKGHYDPRGISLAPPAEPKPPSPPAFSLGKIREDACDIASCVARLGVA